MIDKINCNILLSESFPSLDILVLIHRSKFDRLNYKIKYKAV